MSIKIFGTRSNNRGPVWESLSTKFDHPVTAVEALNEAGLNATFVKRSLYYGEDTILGTNLESFPDRKLVVRLPTEKDPVNRPIGIVGKEYGIIQPINLATSVDLLTEKWPVESVGDLGNGRSLFFLLNAGKYDVAGKDPINKYFLISDFHGGGVRAKIAFIGYRLFCSNMLLSALRNAEMTAAFTHYDNVEDRVNLQIGLMKKLQSLELKTIEVFDRMAAVTISTEMFQSVVDRVYPMPTKSAVAEALPDLIDENPDLYASFIDAAKGANANWEYACTRVEAFRQGAQESYDGFNVKHPDMAGSAWAGYNAISENATWRNGSKNTDKDVMFGWRAREIAHAYSAVSELL